MKVLLGSVLALAVAGAAPVFADGNGASTLGQQGASNIYSENENAGPQQTGPQQLGPQRSGDRENRRAQREARRAGKPVRPFVMGERVRPRLLTGRHVVTDYAKFRLEAPRGGDQWIKARHQLVLVSADGMVKTVIQRAHRGRHARHRQPQEQYGPQQQPGDSQQYGPPQQDGPTDDGPTDDQDQ